MTHSSGFNRMSASGMGVLLEFVASPKRPIIKVAPRLRFFQEFTGIENAIVCLEPQMTIDLPSNLSSRSVSDEARAAAVGGTDQESGHRVHTVVQALTPLEDPVERRRHTMRQRRFYARV